MISKQEAPPKKTDDANPQEEGEQSGAESPTEGMAKLNVVWDEKFIRSAFGEVGGITGIKLVKDLRGNKLDYCFVAFANETSAREAMKLNRECIPNEQAENYFFLLSIVNSTEQSGSRVNPVFLRAAKKKHLEVVEYLLPFILPMGSPTTESSRPQEEELFKALTEGQDGELSTLSLACERGYTSVVRLMLRFAKGSEVNRRYKNGYTLLLFATTKGFAEICKLLVEVGAHADIDESCPLAERPPQSPLISAFTFGHVEVVKYLVTCVKELPSDKERSEFLNYIMLEDGDLAKKVEKCGVLIGNEIERRRKIEEAKKNTGGSGGVTDDVEEVPSQPRLTAEEEEDGQTSSYNVAAGKAKDDRKGHSESDETEDVEDYSSTSDDDEEEEVDSFLSSPEKRAADQSKSSTSCANETEETVFCRHIFECTQCGQRLAEEKTPQKEVAEPKWEKISPHKCSTEALDQTFKQPFVYFRPEKIDTRAVTSPQLSLQLSSKHASEGLLHLSANDLYKSVCSLFDAIGICVGFVAQTAHCYRLLKKFILKKLESKAKARRDPDMYDLRRKMREDFNMVFQNHTKFHSENFKKKNVLKNHGERTAELLTAIREIYQNGTINFADFKSQKGLKLTDDKQGSRDVDFFQPDGKYASYLPIIKD